MSFREEILEGFGEILSELGETVLYRSDGGKADSIERAVTWDDNPANMPDGVRVVAWGIASDFADARKDDLIERNGNTYKIAETPVPDGMGGVTIHLRQTQKARE